MTLTSGTRLGPYEILAPLGAGGMGEVYRAHDTRLGRDVAIKVLPPHLAATPEVRARFEREARTISQLNHPHICTLHDIGHQDGTDYLVMELLEGETLAQRLEKGPLPVAEVLRSGTQIADALDRAHRGGRGAPRLQAREHHADEGRGEADGLRSGARRRARAAAAGALTESPTVSRPLTAEGTIVGTFQYMAPEQLEGKEADARTDLWALGCVLYEMATGKRAFEGTSQASLIAAILKERAAADHGASAAHAAGAGASGEAVPGEGPRRPLAERARRDARTAMDFRGRVTGRRSGHGASTTSPWRGEVVGHRASGHRGRSGRDRRDDDAPVGSSTSFRSRPRPSSRIRSSTRASRPTGRASSSARRRRGTRRSCSRSAPSTSRRARSDCAGLHLLAVSSSGELAVLTGARHIAHCVFTGTLARLPLGAEAPRELLDNVRDADWNPDGSALAIIREVGGRDRLEYPIGKVLCESGGYLSDVRFSPRGDRIAFFDHPSRWDDRGSIKVTDLSGHVKELSTGYAAVEGIAWSLDGRQVYFSGADSTMSASVGGWVFAVTLSGRRRVAQESAGALVIHDVSRQGRWLATRDDIRVKLVARPPGTTSERDLSWLDGSLDPALSADGRTIVFCEAGGEHNVNYQVCLRGTNGSPVMQLGEGSAQGNCRRTANGYWHSCRLPPCVSCSTRPAPVSR